MALIACPECNREISDKALSYPHRGAHREDGMPAFAQAAAMAKRISGFEYKTKATLFGLPVVQIATGFDLEKGRPIAAVGIIDATHRDLQANAFFTKWFGSWISSHRIHTTRQSLLLGRKRTPEAISP